MNRIGPQDCRQLNPSVGLTEPCVMGCANTTLIFHMLYFALNPVWDTDPYKRM